VPRHARGGQTTSERDSDRDARGEFAHRDPDTHAQCEPDTEAHGQIPELLTSHALTVAGFVGRAHAREAGAAVTFRRPGSLFRGWKSVAPVGRPGQTPFMSAVEIVQVDPLDQQTVDGWLAVRQAVRDADFPQLPPTAPASDIVGLLRRRSDRRVEQWVARRDQEVVAALELLFHLRDNQHLVGAELVVAPDHRRQGIGTALAGHAERRAVAEGRDTLVAYAVDTITGGPPRSPHGQRFAEALGYVRVLDEVHRVADLTTVSDAELDRLLSEAWQRAEGYEIVQWAGAKPEEILEGAAYLNGRMFLDAPLGEMDLRHAVFDTGRVREMEAHHRALGMLELGTVVRHRASGEVAGYTEITLVPGDEEHCWQGNTIVDPNHRGRRLGTILKIENYRLLRSYRPRMRYVHTWNAEVNAYMISINEAIGYRAVDRWIGYQKKLPT